MATANGVRAQLAYVLESTPYQTPGSPTLTRLRATSRNINLTKNLLESEEVAAHGQESDVRHGFNRVEGSIGGEFLTGAWDDWNSAVFGADWSTTINVTSVSVGATAPSTITRGSGSFVSDGIKVGDVVTTTGFAAAGNNGRFFVTAVTALSLTVATSSAAPLTTQSGGTLSCVGKRLDIGTNLKTFTVERRFEDVNLYQPFIGVTPITLGIGIQPEQMVKLNYGILGIKSSAMTGSSISGSAPTEAPSGSPYDAFVGQIILGNAVVGAVTGMNININTNRSTMPIVGSKFSEEIYEARRQIGGDLTSLFKNSTVFNAFLNETEQPVGLRFDDPNGTDFNSIYMPRVKINSAPMDPGPQGPVSISSSFRALYSATRQTSISMFRSNIT